MARTLGDMIERVGVLLQDEAGIRYTRTQLIGLLNDAVLEARSIRPDLFVHVFDSSLPQISVEAADEATFPLPDQFFPAVCYYVSGRAEMRDDEFAVDGRAMTLLSVFGKKLLQGA